MTRALTILIALALFCGAANADDRQVKVTAQTCRDINQLIAQGEIRSLSDEQLVRGFCNLMSKTSYHQGAQSDWNASALLNR